VDYDADAGVADLLNDYHKTQYAGGYTDDEPEPTAKAFYDIFDAVHGPKKVLGKEGFADVLFAEPSLASATLDKAVFFRLC
jgi:hypothetical protein